MGFPRNRDNPINPTISNNSAVGSENSVAPAAVLPFELTVSCAVVMPARCGVLGAVMAPQLCGSRSQWVSGSLLGTFAGPLSNPMNLVR